jgi:hypothetical protein
MATQTYEFTTPGTYTFDFPANATEVSFILRGAVGGSAYSASYVDPRNVGIPSPFQEAPQGQYMTGSLDPAVVGGQTITVYLGNRGGIANSSFGFDGGAAGGSGYYSGGAGGSSGGGETWVTDGGGSGGGGASALVAVGLGSVLAVAGGGGGCGGSAYNYGGQVPTYNTNLTTNITGAGNGGNGGSGIQSNGGSGGGGGGVPAGAGGGASSAGNHIPGRAGSGGGGYYNNLAVPTCAITAEAFIPNNLNDGYFYITYESGDPPNVQFSSNPAVVVTGGSTTLSWEVTAGVPADNPTSITLNGVAVAATDTLVVSPTVSTDYTISATGAGGTTTDTIRIVVIAPDNGTGAGTTTIYGTGESSVGIPPNITAYLTIAAGRGGSGGSDANGGGCGGAGGRVGVFEILPTTEGKQFTLYVGTQGNNGASGSPGNKAGGTGGVSGAGNGGAGGRDSQGGGWSGSGGGGGGASGVFDVGLNQWVCNVGGGGGGGGGSWNVSCSNQASSGGGVTAAAVGAVNGNGGANCGGDGGGGGGGGGGSSAGGGGGAGNDNSSGGSSGGGGGSNYNNTILSLDSQSTNNNNGYAILSFTIPPTIAYFRANDDSPETDILQGEAVVLSWSTLFNGQETATAAEIDNGVGVVPVGQQFTSIVSPAETTTYTLTASGGGVFAQQTVTVNVTGPDDVSDTFSFSSIQNAELITMYETEIVTISGLGVGVNAFVTNGAELSVNGGAYSSATQTVNNGDTIQVRMESSSLYSTEKESSISVGVTNTTWSVFTKQEPANVPNAFSFNDVDDAPLSTYISSNVVTISGLNVIGTVSTPLSGAESSVNGGPFSTAVKLINNGETLALRVLTSGALGDSVQTGVSVGSGPVVTWNVTNVTTADDNPDFFDFTDKLNMTANTYVTSDILTITGLNVPTAVTVTNGDFRINGGSWVTSGNINVNDTLQLRLLSSTEPGGEVETTVTIGNLPLNQLSDDWKVVTTTAGDIDPDAFSFINQDNQPPNTLVNSNVVQIFGITSPSPISINGGEMQINGGPWVTSGSINNGETLRLRITTSASLGTPVSISITVG